MPVIANYCKAEIRFICKTHSQKTCVYFETDEDIPSTACKYGLPDRSCKNKKARKQALMFYCRKNFVWLIGLLKRTTESLKG